MIGNEVAAILRNCSLFTGVGDGELEALVGELTYHTAEFAKGRLLFLRGDEYTSLSILLQGEVVAQMQGYSGKTVTIETLKAPEPLASAILFAPQNYLPVQVVALKITRTMIIPKYELLRLFQHYPVILENFLSDMGNRLSILSEKHRLSHFSTIRQKAAGFLLDQSALQKSTTVVLPYTKETIAELFGVTRPALSRVFLQMESEGALRSAGKRVVITRELLREVLEED